MKNGRAVLVGVPAAALVVCVVASFLTRGAMSNLPFLQGRRGGAKQASVGLVDQRPWQTVAALAPLAVSAEEQGFAREAERLADHEVDQGVCDGVAAGGAGDEDADGRCACSTEEDDEFAGAG